MYTGYNPWDNARRRVISDHLEQYSVMSVGSIFEIVIEPDNSKGTIVPFYNIGIMPKEANDNRRINVSARNKDRLVEIAEEILAQRGHGVEKKGD